jgi:HTTM domain
MNESLPRRLGRHLVRVYASADPRSLAAGRIALALVLLLDLGRRAASMNTWYTNEGLLPNHTLLWRPTFQWVFSFFYMASWPHEAAIGFLVCALSYLALLVGFRTRIAHVASLLSVLSLHGRVLFTDNGGDVVLSELCLWTVFLPTGLRFSIDALRARSEKGPNEPEETKPVVSVAITALLLQLGLIYLFNAWSKTGPTWREGSAVHYVLHQSRIVTTFGVWASHHLSLGFLHLLTRAALALEWSIAILVLLPYGLPYSRRGAIAAMWALHVGFALFLNLAIFVPAMLAYSPNLLTAEDWNALGAWWAKRKKPDLGAVRRACTGLARYASPPRDRPRGRIVSEVIAGLTLLVAGNQMLAENQPVRRFVRVDASLPTQVAVSYLQLFEAWSMFAPDAPTTDVNVYFDAVTADGRHVDPVSERASPRYPAPGPSIPERLDSDPFLCDYIVRITSRVDYQQALTEWILRYPERTGRDADHIVSFEGFMVEQDSPRPGETDPRNQRVTSFIKWPRR